MKRKNGGFSLIEIMIGTVLLALLVAVVYSLMNSASSAYVRDSAKQTLQDNARRVLDDITNEVRDARQGSFQLLAPHPTEPGVDFAVSFNKVIGYKDKAPVLSPTVEFWYQKAEGRLLRYGPQGDGEKATLAKSVVCDFIKADGFKVTQPATNKVDLSITLYTLAEGKRTIEVTMGSSVAIRN